MLLDPETLEVAFEDCPFGVSARRIFEHMTLGQINPFGRAVSSVRSLDDAAELIDLVRLDSLEWLSLTGLTLAGLDDAELSSRMLGDDVSTVRRGAAHGGVRAFVTLVETAAKQHAARRAARNVPSPLLPVPGTIGPFGIPFLRSRLRDHLATQARVKAGAGQWCGAIRNLAEKGLRSEELQRSRLVEFLESREADARPLTGNDLEQVVDFSDLRLSVIANVTEARTQLRFEVVPDRPLAKIKGEAKPQAGQRRRLCLFDRVLGYRIEEVEHAALWENDRHWQAVTFDGRVLRNRNTRRAIFEAAAAASVRAQEHAREVLPKLLASERWFDWSWTGGEDYREWLITLPCFPTTYLSSHFAVRNVLAHVRCDWREGAEGERVLMLHEVQSDWMQDARRAARDFSNGAEYADDAPFLHEWPALTLKLMVLHAAHMRADALGWTRGSHQVHRYRGLGSEGLKVLYDRTLPREVNRMLKPFGVACESVDVYVPENFTIRRTEAGYEVRSFDGTSLGVAPSFHEARAFLPDGAHERLYDIHGVRLDEQKRAAILERGFAAWG